MNSELLYSIFICLSLLISVSSIPYDENISWYKGAEFKYIWIVYIVIVGVGVLLNSICILHIYTSSSLLKLDFVRLIFTLSIADILLGITCIVQCILNYNYSEFFGLEAGCQAQAFLHGVFMYWEASILALISYEAERRATFGQTFDNIFYSKMIISTGLFSVILAVISIYAPYGGYKLYPSGTFCYIDYVDAVSGACLIFGIFVPILFMIERYIRIWRNINAAQLLLRERGIEIQAKASDVLKAKRMGAYTLSYLICCIPAVFCIIIPATTREYAPVWLQIFSVISIFIHCILDPVLFYIFYEDARNDIYFICSHYIRRVSRNIHPMKRRRSIISNNWRDWMENEEYYSVFQVWCKQNMVLENLLFYHDTKNHKLLCQKIYEKLQIIIEASQQKKGIIPNLLHEIKGNHHLSKQFTTFWEVELYDLTVKIYQLYIDSPTAPLEVNIASSTRSNIRNKLRIQDYNGTKRITANSRRSTFFTKNPDNVNSSKTVKKRQFATLKTTAIPPFPNISSISLDNALVEVTSILTLFDEAREAISQVIATDVFPRFKKSTTYNSILTNDQHQLQQQQDQQNNIYNEIRIATAP